MVFVYDCQHGVYRGPRDVKQNCRDESKRYEKKEVVSGEAQGQDSKNFSKEESEKKPFFCIAISQKSSDQNCKHSGNFKRAQSKTFRQVWICKICKCQWNDEPDRRAESVSDETIKRRNPGNWTEFLHRQPAAAPLRRTAPIIS